MEFKMTVKVVNVRDIARKYAVRERIIQSIMTNTSRRMAGDAASVMRKTINDNTDGTRRLSRSIHVEQDPRITFGRTNESVVRTLIKVTDIGGPDKTVPEVYWQYVDKGFTMHYIPIGYMSGWLGLHPGFAGYLASSRRKYWAPQYDPKGRNMARWSRVGGLQFVKAARDFLERNLPKTIKSDIATGLR